MYSSVALRTVTVLWNHHPPSLFLEVFHLPKLKLCTYYNSPVPLPQALAPTFLLSASMTVTTLATFRRWNRRVFVLLWLASFTELNVPRCSMCQHVLPFQGWIMIHCRHKPHFVYPSSTDGHLSGFLFRLLWIMLLWTLMYKRLFKPLLLILSGIHPEVELLDHIIIYV